MFKAAPNNKVSQNSADGEMNVRVLFALFSIDDDWSVPRRLGQNSEMTNVCEI